MTRPPDLLEPLSNEPVLSGRRLRYVQVKLAVVHSSIRLPRMLGSIYQLFRLSDFVRDSHLRESPHFSRRYQLYGHVQDKLIGDAPVDYLEFGVWKGESILKWSEINRHPASRFFGFDTFEGLPEAWSFATGAMPAGRLSTGGKVPEVQDQRVQFVKGLFQDTMNDFLRHYEPLNRLVIHCDADLYSSTLYALASLDEFIKPGTVVIFDEFGVVNHEFRAMMDYMASFRRTFAPVGWAGGFYEQVAFVAES
jgi:O-methyltransferase